LKVFAAGLPVRDSPFEKAPGSISRTGCKDSAAVDGKCPCWRLRCTRRKPELRSATLVPLGRSPGSNSEWLTAHSRCEAQWLASDDGHVRPAGWRWRRREPGSSYNGRSRNAQHDSTSAWKPLGVNVMSNPRLETLLNFLLGLLTEFLVLAAISNYYLRWPTLWPDYLVGERDRSERIASTGP
jgi:hypothetical protein